MANFELVHFDERVVSITLEELVAEGWSETESTSSMVLTFADMQKLMSAADRAWGDNWDMETTDE